MRKSHNKLKRFNAGFSISLLSNILEKDKRRDFIIRQYIKEITNMSTNEQFKSDHDKSRNAYDLYDDLYRRKFGDQIIINRITPNIVNWSQVSPEERNGIDTYITHRYLTRCCIQSLDLVENAIVIKTSEKALSYDKLEMYGNNVTIKYLTNVYTNTPGELFTGMSDIYCCSYLTEDKTTFAAYTMLFTQKFFKWVRDTSANFEIKPISTGNASIIIIPVNKIPNEFIYSNS